MSRVLVDTAKLSERGQIIVPKEIRERLGLKEGARLIMVCTEDAIVLQKIEVAGGWLKARELIEKARAITGKLGIR